MKNVIRVLWIVKNFFFFLKSLSRYNHFNWDNSACRSINSTIDSTSMVHGSYMLNNVSIGYASYISTNALMANTNVGRFCSIGPNVVSGMGIHPINGISTHPAFYSKKKKSKITLSSVDLIKEHLPVTIGNDVFIGANVTILDGISIGD
ncbi:MAG: antibiotic acetyltransferase, partial [Rickettsiales bacterium]